MTINRVMVVDDHAVVRQGISALLSAQTDIEVVGLAADGIEALHQARVRRPHVVLMDLGMPRMNGIEATRRLSSTEPAPAIIMLTMSDDDSSLLAAVRAGARGYLLKDADGDEVVAAIHAVNGGQAVFGPGVASSVLNLLQTPPVMQEPPFKELTNRERQVLDLVAAHHGNAAIARRLGISSKTVANVVSGLVTKLGEPDRAGLGQRARAAGLGVTLPKI